MSSEHFTTSKKYNPALDALRVVSILAVILIHTSTRKLEVTHYDLVHVPWTLLLNQISRFAVPLFFMISGFALELSYSSKINYFTYLKRRANRILIPYVFWSFIYYFFIYRQHSDDFFSALLAGSASYQLYFIPSLIIFYAIFPILHKFYEILSNKYVLTVLFVIQVFILNYDYQFHTSPFPYLVAVALFNYFVFVIGMVAAHHHEDLMKLAGKWKFALIPSLAFAGYLVFNEGFSTYLKTYNYLAFYSQWRPSILLYTILSGLVFYYLFSKMNFKFIKQLSDLSFFVFFIHVIILETIWSYIGIHIVGNYWFDAFFFVSTASLSFIIAYLIRKIPYLAKLTG